MKPYLERDVGRIYIVMGTSKLLPAPLNAILK